jgi:hypothetical protein
MGIEPLRLDDRPNLAGRSAGAKRVDDRCSEHSEALLQFGQDTPKG